MNRQLSGAAAIVLALAVSACEGGGSPSAPDGSSDAPVTASLQALSAQPTAPFVGVGTGVGVFTFNPSFDLLVFATRTVDLSSVTMQMIDGSHLGGPMITMPSSQL